MDDHRDDLDNWLQARIDPLPPPPGTFEMIKRRARRRRYRQVAVSAAAAGAVAAAVIVLPHVTSVLRISQNPTAASAASAASGSRANGASSGQVTVNASGAPTPAAARLAPSSSATFRLPPVPADFAATSVTFVGLKTGWVIGQAGLPGQKCATAYCTSVARTDNAGQSWFGVPAPVTGAPNGASGVSQIRFLDASNGWAFGPQLWATHDGGQTWTQVQTGGQRVTSLETVGNRVFAIFASCSGTGADFAAQCTSFSLYSAPASGDSLVPLSPTVTSLGNGGRAASASLALTATQGYLLAPDGTLYSGPVSGAGSWQQAAPGPAGAASCSTGPAQPNGQPSGAMLAAATASDLALACSVPAASGGGAQVFASADGGVTWQQAGTVTGGTVTSVAAQPGGEIILATTAGLEVSGNGGASWQPVMLDAGLGGFSYVGMTSIEQGVAVPADASGHAIWFTFDAGRTWRRSPIA
jgi:hypothetical protein